MAKINLEQLNASIFKAIEKLKAVENDESSSSELDKKYMKKYMDLFKELFSATASNDHKSVCRLEKELEKLIENHRFDDSMEES